MSALITNQRQQGSQKNSVMMLQQFTVYININTQNIFCDNIVYVHNYKE